MGAFYPELEGDVAILGRVVQFEWHALCEVLVREERLEVDEGGTGRFAAAGGAQIVCDTRILEARDEGAREAVAEVGERCVAEGNCGKGGEVSARFRRHGRENRGIHRRKRTDDDGRVCLFQQSVHQLLAAQQCSSFASG